MNKKNDSKRWWKFGKLRAQPIVEKDVTTAVPIDIAIEKLRGFVSDHQAKIILTKDNSVELEISSDKVGMHNRKSDRTTPYCVEVTFKEDHVERKNNSGMAQGLYVRTCIHLSIRPKRARSRRKAEMAERARLIFQSLKAYLMASEAHEEAEKSLGSVPAAI